MKKKKITIISLILLIIGVVTLTCYCYCYDSVKLNIINKSDYLVNSFSIKCGEEKIELSKLQPQSKIVKRLYSFTGQELSFTLKCRNQFIIHNISGPDASKLLGINIIIENKSSVAKDSKYTQFVKIRSDLLKK